MAHITNGHVSYERRVKTGDFEHKHAAVAIHYALDAGDDADALIEFAGTLATSHVFKLLGAKPAPLGQKVPDGPPPSNGVVPVADPSPAVDAVAPVIVDVVVADPRPVDVLPPVTNLKQAKRAAKTKQGPMTVISETDVVVEHIPFVPPTAELIYEDFTADAPAVSDAELGQALSRVAAKLKDRPRIQALIGEFVQSGQSYTLIPAVRRAEFITKLEAL